MKYIDPGHGKWPAVRGDDGPLVSMAPQLHLLLTFDEWQAA